MSLFQSDTVMRRKSPPTPQAAGITAKAVFKYDFTQAFTAASDLLEIGVLPATAQLMGAEVIGVGLGAITADIGLMDGEAGSRDETRTAGVELFDDQSVNNATASTATADCLAIAPEGIHRGIGVALSGNVAAGASKTLWLVIEYTY